MTLDLSLSLSPSLASPLRIDLLFCVSLDLFCSGNTTFTQHNTLSFSLSPSLTHSHTHTHTHTHNQVSGRARSGRRRDGITHRCTHKRPCSADATQARSRTALSAASQGRCRSHSARTNRPHRPRAIRSTSPWLAVCRSRKQCRRGTRWRYILQGHKHGGMMKTSPKQRCNRKKNALGGTRRSAGYLCGVKDKQNNSWDDLCLFAAQIGQQQLHVLVVCQRLQTRSQRDPP